MVLTEINPLLDPANKKPTLYGEHKLINGSKTIKLGCELVLSALGRGVDDSFLDEWKNI